MDDLFMKDFLLTYKTFLPSPLAVVDQLKKAWVEGLPEQRERVGGLGFLQGERENLQSTIKESRIRNLVYGIGSPV